MSVSEARSAESLEDYTLLAILGERPQVMTELIWSLAQDGAVPERIIVLTTAHGERALRAELLGDRSYRDFSDHWNDRWKPFCSQVLDSDPLDLEVEVPLDSDGNKIEDIYDPDDGRHFENWCFDLVHSLTREIDGPPLYGCIAGGRKTMTQDVTTAFTLYARGPDRLFHVIVPEKVEEDRTFFWPREDRSEHAEHADDVYRVDKSFPHLRARLEDSLLSDVGELNERSHYKELLDELDPDRRALTKPQKVTLRIQMETSANGRDMKGDSGSTLSVWDATGKTKAEVNLSVKKLATLLFLWNRLWRPGERTNIPHTLMKTETADKYRRVVYEAFHGELPTPFDDEYPDYLPWYPEGNYYTKYDNKYKSQYSKSRGELNTEFEGGIERNFSVQSVPPDKLSNVDSNKDPFYAFWRTLPEDVQLRIEIVPDEYNQLEKLATPEGWPFKGLPVPEIADE